MEDMFTNFAEVVCRVQGMIFYEESPEEIHKALVKDGFSPDHAHLIIRAAWDAGANKPSRG